MQMDTTVDRGKNRETRLIEAAAQFVKQPYIMEHVLDISKTTAPPEGTFQVKPYDEERKSFLEDNFDHGHLTLAQVVIDDW